MRAEDLELARFWNARENLRRLAANAPAVGPSGTFPRSGGGAA